ncbi:MAG: hypothetical protein ACTSSH_00240 [Candidatus Heimdallarchaeota archaeon]
MPDPKLISKGPIFSYFKKQTDGLNVSNETKEHIITYLNEKLKSEVDQLCTWALSVSELQGKRTIQDKDWEFIKNKLENE